MLALLMRVDLAQIQFVGLDGSWNTFENRSLAKGSTESQFYQYAHC